MDLISCIFEKHITRACNLNPELSLSINTHACSGLYHFLAPLCLECLCFRLKTWNLAVNPPKFNQAIAGHMERNAGWASILKITLQAIPVLNSL